MTQYEEILARLKTAHMFFGEDAINRGSALIDKYFMDGAITQEEYEKLIEENANMVCEEPWVPEGHQ